MRITIDFRGVCILGNFPNSYKSVNGAQTVLEKLANEGHELRLYVKDTKNFSDKMGWFRERGIKIIGTATDRRDCDLFISIENSPSTLIKYNRIISDTPFVDWVSMQKKFLEKNILKN
ncbi:hypothetical protein [Tenacibaculum phage Larrie]|nr:hypothetical protein [Tenacibaculum phage Larrie]